ncbi:hypothetical protein ACMD2_26598 [Ananas comosus]|uniref:Uncharacterized protein n=1 Tax=Ananas comosus TaxID=4615 RepID=A0A199URZ7_ANACO|nr:hypothetical protein ACMD2_26598 [Ananas comosus]
MLIRNSSARFFTRSVSKESPEKRTSFSDSVAQQRKKFSTLHSHQIIAKHRYKHSQLETNNPLLPPISPAENAHHPRGPGCSSASASSFNLIQEHVSLSNANASDENFPAPRCPRSLGSTSPPYMITYFPILEVQNTLRGLGLLPVVSTGSHFSLTRSKQCTSSSSAPENP